MPTNRSPRQRYRRQRITRGLVELYARSLDGDHEARMQLHRALGLRPWHPFPEDVDGVEPSADARLDPMHDGEHAAAVAYLRVQLEAALAQRAAHVHSKDPAAESAPQPVLPRLDLHS
jgi:hypothetical protein